MTTDLRQLLDTVAESTVPDDLAHQAVAQATLRRRNRFVVTGSIVATQPSSWGSLSSYSRSRAVTEDVQPANGAELPAQLPTADGLPTLADAPLSTAAAAYVVDGEVVFIDAETSQAVKLFPSTEDIPLSISATAALSSRLSADAGWSRVVLSPDGTRALLTAPSLPTADGNLGDFLYVLDIGNVELDRVPDIRVASDEGATWRQLLAWSPDGGHFSCACVDSGGGSAGAVPQWMLIPSIPPWYPETQGTGITRIDVSPFQVAAGASGFYVQLEPQGKWLSAGVTDLSLGAVVGQADLLALSGATTGHFAEVRNTIVREQGLAWSIDIEEGLPDTQPNRPSWREGTAVGVSWAGEDSYIVTVRPADAAPGEPPPPVALDVVVVDAAGNERELTRTAVGSSVPSFAGNVTGTA